MPFLSPFTGADPMRVFHKYVYNMRGSYAEELEKIVVHGSQVTVDHVGWPYRPDSMTTAQLNLPFCVATLLIEGDVSVDQFKPEAIHDAARIALSRNPTF